MIIDIDLPRVTQMDATWCGPAVVQAVVAKYTGYAEPQYLIAGHLDASGRGTERHKIKDHLRIRGLDVQEINGLPDKLEAAKSYIYDIRAYGNGHYVCIVGKTFRRYYLMDPALEVGYGYIPASEMLGRLTDGTGLVVSGPKIYRDLISTEVER